MESPSGWDGHKPRSLGEEIGAAPTPIAEAGSMPTPRSRRSSIRPFTWKRLLPRHRSEREEAAED